MASPSINRRPHHVVESVDFAGTDLILIVDGETHRFPLEEVSPVLAAANESARQQYQVSPAGYGIHWETLDEDLSIDALLGILHAPPEREVLESSVAESSPDYPARPPS